MYLQYSNVATAGNIDNCSYITLVLLRQETYSMHLQYGNVATAGDVVGDV